MSIEHEIPELDAAGLRRFGITTGLILAVLFGVLFPWLLERSPPKWPWAIAVILVVWALAAPSSLRPVYLTWMKLGALLGKITSPVILSIMFIITILPPALVMKLMRRDPMHRRFDDAVDTYRVQSHPLPKDNLRRPF